MADIESANEMKRTEITGEIRKIVVFYRPSDGCLGAIRLFDSDGKIIYEGGRKSVFTNSWIKKYEIFL